MSSTPAELLKSYVNKQQFTSTTEVMEAMKDMFEGRNNKHPASSTLRGFWQDQTYCFILSIIIPANFLCPCSLDAKYAELSL